MRTTNDKKDNRVIVRLNDADREYLEEMSSREGKSISDYVRGMIARDRFCESLKVFDEPISEKF